MAVGLVLLAAALAGLIVPHETMRVSSSQERRTQPG
jgi:hypothetical protein